MHLSEPETDQATSPMTGHMAQASVLMMASAKASEIAPDEMPASIDEPAGCRVQYHSPPMVHRPE